MIAGLPKYLKKYMQSGFFIIGKIWSTLKHR